eukprot:6690979-Prymnesium_polylepis.1
MSPGDAPSASRTTDRSSSGRSASVAAGSATKAPGVMREKRENCSRSCWTPAATGALVAVEAVATVAA